MMTSSAREVLKRRARALAQPVAATAEEDSVPVLVVGLDNGTTYGIEARFLQHIVDDMSLCRLPMGSGDLIAVTVVGGVAVPVADLGSVLGTASPRQDRPFLVLVGGASPLGLLVDQVVGVLELRQRELRPLPKLPGDPAVNVHRGLMPGDVPLLDVEVLLQDSRLMVSRPPYAPSSVPTSSHSGAT
jgi:chemotaxis signal transduction protein